MDKVNGRDVSWEEVLGGGLEGNDAKAVLGCLYTIVTNAVRYGLTGAQLEHELIMLGVTEDISERLAALVEGDCDALRARMLEHNPRRPTVLSSTCHLVADDTATLTLGLSNGNTRTLTTSGATIRSLLNELQIAHDKLTTA